MNIVFVPHNAYHTRNMALLVPYLKSKGHSCIFVDIDKVYGEGAGEQIRKLNLDRYEFTNKMFSDLSPDVVVCMNDWGGVVRSIILSANFRKIPTVGIIEGVQDFKDTHIPWFLFFKKRRPYSRVKFRLLTGLYDQKFFSDDRSYMMGVPRFEEHFKQGKEYPSQDIVLINCNFSYGVQDKYKQVWLDQVITACNNLGLPFKITKHHADKTDLGEHQPTAMPFLDALAKSSLLVSRFSTCILEAMICGRPIVYHNPHREMVDTFRESMGAYPITSDVEELTNAIRYELLHKDTVMMRHKHKLNHHLTRFDSRYLLKAFDKIESSKQISCSPFGAKIAKFIFGV